VAVGTGDEVGVGEAEISEVPVDVGLAVGVGDAARAACEKLVTVGNKATVNTVAKIRDLFQKNRLAFITQLSLDKPRKETAFCHVTKEKRLPLSRQRPAT
jgi:hypothetical protein